jgi:hypothetical protein
MTDIKLQAFTDDELRNRMLLAMKVDQHQNIFYFMNNIFACPYCGKMAKSESTIRHHFEACDEYQAKKHLYQPQAEQLNADKEQLTTAAVTGASDYR